MKVLLSLLAVLAVAAPVLAETYITTDITADTTWSLAGSPYIVQANVNVTSPNVLTIDPGVVVEFDGYTQLQGYNGGTIVAVGTEGNEILFTSHSGTPAPDDWDSVYLYYSPASVFTYCVFEYGRYNLYADRCNPTFSYCTTRYGDSSGIMCEVASPTITNCEITENDRGIHLSDGSPSITGCNITDNNRGLYVDGPDADPVIHGCNIYNNSSDNMYIRDYLALPKVIIDAENNWWGVDNEPAILLTINIGPPYAPYVEVDVDPWLHEVPVEDVTWGRVKAFYAD